MPKYFAFAAIVIAAYVLLPFVLLDTPATATTRGVVFVLLSGAATAIVALLVGCLGLFYKSNRFAGFVVVTVLAALFMVLGVGSR